MAGKRIKKKTEQEKFQERLVYIFVNAGFDHFETERTSFKIGNKDLELDHIFVYENIMIECEDTINSYIYRNTDKKNKYERENLKYKADKHKSNKKEAAELILKYKKDFIDQLGNRYTEFNSNGKYYASDYQIFFLYFDYMSEEPTEKDIEKYKPLIFVPQATMEYFCTISSSIKKSFRYELFRFLKIKRSEVLDNSTSSGRRDNLKCSIVYPERWTGYSDGIRVVTFMAEPKILLETACVLRKDSWDGKDDLYQRLITEKRIKEIRDFLVKENTMFLNNIIVTLPDTVTFLNNDNKPVSIEDIDDIKEQYQVSVPIEYNSMAIIDGQHRVYAFYEDNCENDVEKKIAIQRERNCLLVTGIVYPQTDEWTEVKKRQFESGLFLAINRNSKQVDADTLILVQTILDPTSREGLSRKVIEKMNTCEPFEKMFKLTKVSDAPISISTIVQYALVSLVNTNIDSDKKTNANKTLYYYWLIKNEKNRNYKFTISDRDKYVSYCANCLCEYFKAIKSHFINEWNDPNSKILKVVAINAFIIAYRETLYLTHGPQKCNYYIELMKGWNFTFKEVEGKHFNYSGSSYAKLANNEIIPWFQRQLPSESTNIFDE